MFSSAVFVAAGLGVSSLVLFWVLVLSHQSWLAGAQKHGRASVAQRSRQATRVPGDCSDS